jgi:hypothetical protein
MRRVWANSSTDHHRRVDVLRIVEIEMFNGRLLCSGSVTRLDFSPTFDHSGNRSLYRLQLWSLRRSAVRFIAGAATKQRLKLTAVCLKSGSQDVYVVAKAYSYGQCLRPGHGRRFLQSAYGKLRSPLGSLPIRCYIGGSL